MTTALFQLFDGSNLTESWSSDTPVSVGRQDQGEPEVGPFSSAGGQRAILAPIGCRDIPRRFFRLECDKTNQLMLVNCNPHLDVRIEGGRAINNGESLRIRGPVTILLTDSIRLRISPASSDDEDDLRSLQHRPMDPASVSMASFYQQEPDPIASNLGAGAASGPQLLDMLQHVLPVIRESVTSDLFFKAAAAAAIRIAGLNRALVALFHGDKRVFRAEVYADALHDEDSQLQAKAPDISDTIIEGVQQAGVTKIYERGMANSMHGESLQQLHEAICAPILDKDRAVIGVLYGDRWSADLMQRPTDIEAQLVEILAGAIAAGLARQTEERQRTSMELFFSDVVAKHIVANAALLEPKEENITMMFCDVRNFSSISKQLGPTRTVEWMQDTFTALSVCVEETGGVVINYVGDELIAMWGAPEPQGDHAARSLRTAQAIMQWLSETEEQWTQELGQPLRVGIGINSGLAAVGNTGSRIKFQYGVFGNVVNLASRLQSATKQFGVQCLVANSTALQTGSAFPLRELATIQVVGINQEVVVKEMAHAPSPTWRDLCRRYEAALSDYQQRRFADATRKLGDILREYPEDEPSMRLLGLSVAQLRQPSVDFSPVDVLTEK